MIQRRRAEIHETKTGHERWLVSYSDFITLLFGFFVVMYSVSQVNEQKYRTLTDTLATVFEGRAPSPHQLDSSAERYPVDLNHQIQNLTQPVNLISTEQLASQLNESLMDIVNSGVVTVRANEEWVEIDVNANLLFASAKATPSGDAKIIFQEVASILAPYDNEIEVAGHTDDLPISTSEFANNWSLSSARAVSVVNLLSQNGISPQRLSAVGFGEHRPVASNDNAAGRAKNRRVVLKVARHQPQINDLPQGLFPDGIPTSIRAPQPQLEEPPADVVEPVRLKNGGLLFSSDPELPRNNAQ